MRYGRAHLFDDRFVIGRRDAGLMKGDKILSLLKSLEILQLLNKPERCQRIAGAFPALESDDDRGRRNRVFRL
jgi:hypothetical protein